MLNRSQKAIVKKVRKLVESTHWIKGHYVGYVSESGYIYSSSCDADNLKKCGCFVGLVGIASGGNGLNVTAAREDVEGKTKGTEGIFAAALEILNRDRSRGHKFISVEMWNDRRKTTRKDVLDLCDELLA